MKTNKIIKGDCIKKMKLLPANSIDAIVTDPPYGLSFMGKNWDFGVPGKAFFIEMIRVLKPGGFLLSFGGTRTYHRLVCGIEDAGFEIRDTIMWLYGSGFPKSLNIGKQIDKINGKTTEEFIELGKYLREKRGKIPQNQISKFFPSKTGGLTGCVSNWELGLNVPTKEQWIILKRELELGDKFDYLIDRIEAEREVISKKNKLNAYSDIGYSAGEGNYEKKEINITLPATPEAKEWEGWGTALKPAVEPIVVARKPLSEKNVALNVLKWGTGGINIDGCRIWENTSDLQRIRNNKDGESIFGMIKPNKGNTQGRFPANIILDEEAGKMLDEQSGVSKSSGGSGEKSMGALGDSKYGEYNKKLGENAGGLGDRGGASRFFYCAKASKSERNLGCEDFESKAKCDIDKMGGEKCSMKTGSGNERNVAYKNNHPTVKPIRLMEYLIKLVSRKGAIILDPFLGSGTTAIACLKQNRKFIGIEKEEEYVKIATARIKPFIEQQKLGVSNTYL